MIIMSPEITPSNLYVESLEEKYEGLAVSSYKVREWFSKTDKIFFDCEDSDRSSCLELVLKKKDTPAFVVFFIVKEEHSTFEFMDASYRNLGKETLERFIRRYEEQLKSMTKLSLESRGIKYVELVGYSYESQ